MGTIKNLADRFRSLDWNGIKQDSLQETAPAIIPDMNREQLTQGQTSRSQPIVPQLSDVLYAIKKEATNGLNGRSLLTPDLKNTGDFYKGIITEVTGTALKTYSTDAKSNKLELTYSPYIFGANSNNLSKYATEDLQPVLLQKLKSATVG